MRLNMRRKKYKIYRQQMSSFKLQMHYMKAIAKMTVRCALHMGALKNFDSPCFYGYAHGYDILNGLLFRSIL